MVGGVDMAQNIAQLLESLGIGNGINIALNQSGMQPNGGINITVNGQTINTGQ